MVQWVVNSSPFRLSEAGAAAYNATSIASSLYNTTSANTNAPQNMFLQTVSSAVMNAMPATTSEQGTGHLVLLVFEAVLEVVCVSLPGYIIARMGMFDPEQQKFLSNLNVSLFTPCLIFSKLASQLDPAKFAELVAIPVIFVIMTAVSYFSARVTARLFRLRKRATNFVVAMGVFGNSNSLPISLVLSLAFTISGLHWDIIPGDNDSDVASRGILYLMIFQQLGQIVRWTWGYNYLLQPSNQYSVEEGGTMGLQDEAPLIPAAPPSTDSIDDDSEWEYDEETQIRKAKHPDPFRNPGFNEFNGIQSPIDERPVLFSWGSSYSRPSPISAAMANGNSQVNGGGIVPRLNSAPKPRHHLRNTTTRSDLTDSDHENAENGGSRTPFTAGGASSSSHTSPGSSRLGSPSRERSSRRSSRAQEADENMTSFPQPPDSPRPSSDENTPLIPRIVKKIRRASTHITNQNTEPHTHTGLVRGCCPPWFQNIWYRYVKFFLMKVWDFMNPPLWAMIISIIVAFVPALKKLFFTEGTFVQSSVTRAVNQSGQVAVPLILVVLGANLANSSKTPESTGEESEHVHRATRRHELKLLIASLISRMLLPILIMGPLLALAAKYNPVSILDDPIFIIVCYLLTGAPSALQLAQICQLNGVYENVMARILFWSYVVVLLPSTIILVVSGLAVVKWAQ